LAFGVERHRLHRRKSTLKAATQGIQVNREAAISRTQSVLSAERVYTNDAHDAPSAHSRFWHGMKRLFDVVFAIVALVALIPLLAIIALAIKLDSRGPLLFRQRRYGRDMKPFTVLKFRTMTDGASTDSHRAYIASLAAGGEDKAPGLKKLTDDPRVTRVGRVLRRLSLDELPQFANVLGGSMSLIGPRPAIDYELEHYLPRHYERFAIRPGLSGLWQVSGRNSVGFNEMLDLDVEYARHCSFSTDVRVFLRTPLAMVRGAA
jgi:lipopolysaccharide/colanic/teichoic acid biosynthesis glycosyltransferase